MHPRYHRVPYVLGDSLTSTSNTAKFTEGSFRNDTEFPFEVYGVGFALAAAVASQATQNYRDVGISVADVARGISWTKSASYPRISTLIDLAGNRHDAAPNTDILQYNGTLWSFRRPTIIPPEGNMSIEMRNFVAATSATLGLALKGSLLVPAASARLVETADRFRYTVPWMGRLSANPIERGRPFGYAYPGWTPAGDAARRAPDGTPIIGYERVPYLMTSSQSEANGIATKFTEADFRNDSPFDVHVYAVGLSLAGAEANLATQNIYDVSLRVVDVLRNQEWSKAQVRCSSLVASNGSRMAVGQGSTWHSTKWDLGAGTILPPGGQLTAYMQNENTALGSMTLDVTFLGEQLVPVLEGTRWAEWYRRHIDAVPSYA